MIQNKISKYLSIQREVLGTSFGIAQYRILSILNLIVVYELKDFFYWKLPLTEIPSLFNYGHLPKMRKEPRNNIRTILYPRCSYFLLPMRRVSSRWHHPQHWALVTNAGCNHALAPLCSSYEEYSPTLSSFRVVNVKCVKSPPPTPSPFISTPQIIIHTCSSFNHWKSNTYIL